MLNDIEAIGKSILSRLSDGPCSVRGLLTDLNATSGPDVWRALLIIDRLSNDNISRATISKAIKQEEQLGLDRVFLYLVSQESRLVEEGVLSKEGTIPPAASFLGTPEQLCNMPGSEVGKKKPRPLRGREAI